jgi:hypothetical protein
MIFLTVEDALADGFPQAADDKAPVFSQSS